MGTFVLHTFPTREADGSRQALSISGLDTGIILRWERSSTVISAPGSHGKQRTQSGAKKSTEEVFMCFFSGWLSGVFIAVGRLSVGVMNEDYPSCSTGASHCGGISCCRAQALGTHLIIK